MTDQHPITPPPDLVEQWHSNSPLDRGLTLATQAAQWGADQELEACCEWLREAKNHGFGYEYGQQLAGRFRSSRRPKPPSLKEQALSHLGNAYDADMIDDTTFENIRRALEQLPE
jgi:hypothetical protein